MNRVLIEELNDIAAHANEVEAVEATQSMLRVFLGVALAKVSLEPHVMDSLCYLVDLSREELQLRAKSGKVPPQEIEKWTKYGNRFLNKAYPTLTGLTYTPGEDPPALELDSITDGVRSFVDISLGYKDYARGYLLGDLVFYGDDAGKIATQMHTSSTPDPIFSRNVAPCPIRDVMLTQNILAAIYVDDLGQLCLSEDKYEPHLVTVDAHIQRLTQIANRSKMISASTTNGVCLYDATIASVPIVRKWNVPGANVVHAPLWEHEIFAVAIQGAVRLYDTRDAKYIHQFLGPRSPITELSLGELAQGTALAAGATEACYIWDTRMPGEAILRKHAEGVYPKSRRNNSVLKPCSFDYGRLESTIQSMVYPIGPPKCEALMIRPHNVSVGRGDSIFTYSLLDDDSAPIITRMTGQRIVHIAPFEPKLAASSRLDATSILGCLSVTRPTIITHNDRWNLF